MSSALPFNCCCSVLTPLLGCGGWEAATVLPCWRWRTPARGQELATTQQHPEGHESEPLCDSRTLLAGWPSVSSQGQGCCPRLLTFSFLVHGQKDRARSSPRVRAGMQCSPNTTLLGG